MSNITKKLDNLMSYAKKPFIYLISFLGAAAVSLQNFIAVSALLKDIVKGTAIATRATYTLINGIAFTLGGACSGLVNFCVNIGLLESFFDRLTNKKRPHLTGWQKFRYWFGSSVFVVTGILFGLTTFAVGLTGTLAAISIAAGVFVAGIMTIQELETWLESFDSKESQKNLSLKEMFISWKNSLTTGKAIGTCIAVGNVIALSLLFTMGLATFLTGLGVTAYPAFIISGIVAFTGGAFTEFYFYNAFLAKFCDKINDKLNEFKKTSYAALGLSCNIINALVNGALSYVGIMMITDMLIAASIAVPPIGITIALAATVSLFAAAASFILGLDFWINNSQKLASFNKKETSTMTITQNLKPTLIHKHENIYSPINTIEKNSKISAHSSFFNKPETTSTLKIEKENLRFC